MLVTSFGPCCSSKLRRKKELSNGGHLLPTNRTTITLSGTLHTGDHMSTGIEQSIDTVVHANLTAHNVRKLLGHLCLDHLSCALINNTGPCVIITLVIGGWSCWQDSIVV